ncbi:hypothetical protein VKT23_013371 [Stygiomarasmius scandens]|uniref:Uncharacterized protein n=1 Tax=Marasmiellus scandens TaxID=2682957 RepID=A0ABR1J3T3_9AGAR
MKLYLIIILTLTLLFCGCVPVKALSINPPISVVTQAVPVVVNWFREDEDPQKWYFAKVDFRGFSTVMVTNPGDQEGQLPITFFDHASFRLVAVQQQGQQPDLDHDKNFKTFDGITAVPPSKFSPPQKTTPAPHSPMTQAVSTTNEPIVSETTQTGSVGVSSLTTSATRVNTMGNVESSNPESPFPSSISEPSGTASTLSQNGSGSNTQTSLPHGTSQSAISSDRLGIPVIIAATVGGALLLLMPGIFFWLWRRRIYKKKLSAPSACTFNRDMMSRGVGKDHYCSDPERSQLELSIRSATVTGNISGPVSLITRSSVEKSSIFGEDNEGTVLAMSISEKVSLSPTSTNYQTQTQEATHIGKRSRPSAVLTDRQMYLQEQIIKLRQQMIIVTNSDDSGPSGCDDSKRSGASEIQRLWEQIKQLEEWMESDWALCLKNEVQMVGITSTA